MTTHKQQPKLSLLDLLAEFRKHETAMRSASYQGTAQAERAAEDATASRLAAFFAERGVELVDDRPPPVQSPRERSTIYEDVNGIWRGYVVEVGYRDEHAERFSSSDIADYVIRIVYYEGDEDSASIFDIREFDAEYVVKRTRPRAGFTFSGIRHEAAPMLAALAELERRRRSVPREN